MSMYATAHAGFFPISWLMAQSHGLQRALTPSITSYGINSTVQNGFVKYDPVNNPEQALFSFQIRRGPTD